MSSPKVNRFALRANFLMPSADPRREHLKTRAGLLDLIARAA
ncbi:hypothetical protein [Streptomyces sp. NWU339]|nr:hypothetical protein [Streptomyces sp. NWU339]